MEPTFIVQKNLPQFFKTLNPESTSISPNFEPIDLENPSFHPSSSSLDIRRTNHHHQEIVSDVFIIDINDRNKKLNSKNKASTSVSGNNVIDLNDDDYGDNKGGGGGGGGRVVVVDNDDDDCVFVKRERNLTPKGNHKKYPICVEIKPKLGKKNSIVVDDFDSIQCVDDYEIKPKLGKKNSIVVDDYEIKPEFGKKNSIAVDDFDSVQCVDDYDDGNDEIRIINVKHSTRLSSNSSRKKRKPFSGPSITEVGESSRSKLEVDDEIVAEVDPVEIMFLCEICADSKPKKEAFKIKGCSHSYCSDCMKNYVASKLQDGVSVINCPVPSCSGVLEPEYCREILPFEVFARWGNLLCESVILATQKFYCPFKDCSALLVDDGDEKVTMSECPSCFRLFCAQCRVGWHAGIGCAEYQSLNKDEREKDDIMLRTLAKSKNWQRCPKCKYYVEKSEGCLYMKCRCGVAFCYSCGAIYTDHRYHTCKKCGR